MPLNITYNPNEEEGAEFHCKPAFSLTSLPVQMDTSTKCYLLCNRMLVATVQCKKGSWTGHPELGFWCNEKKGAVKHWIE